MEFKITSQQKNPFLQREEYTIQITANSNPTTEQIKTELKTDPELTIIKKIHNNFGTKNFTAKAVVYNDKKAKEKIETIPKKVKKKLEEEAKATAESAKKEEPTPTEKPTEQPATETPKEEAPAEEKAEEKKEETKPEEPKTE